MAAMSYAAVSKNAKRRNQPVLLIDARTLQDLKYAERGIPSHARNAVRFAREVSAFAAGAWMVAVTDPALDPLPAAVVAWFDEITHNGYYPDAPPGSVFLQLSPMQAEQIFIARLLQQPTIRSAVLVYDFIPFDDCARYLRVTSTRLDYYTSLAWLKHYDLFLPISTDTAARLEQLYPVARGRSVVTGVPLAPWLEGVTASPAPVHILAVGGEDLRKNPEVLIRAHAASQMLQARRIPLVVAGNYEAGKRAEFRALAVAHGGAAALLQVPGRVSNAALRAQYENAICVATPSRAEGFSMPVIEAMAAGVPAIASDIPAHAALVTDPSLRFGPDDDVTLTALLERIVGDAALRAAVISAQATIWPQFAARAVAAKIWAAIEPLAVPARLALPPRPRVAMLTPLPPARSGVANYSAALAGPLAAKVDLTLFTASEAAAAAPVSGLAHLSPRFDRVVSVIGNSSAHYEIYDLALRYGAACICHDARLLGLVSSKSGLWHAAAVASRELDRKVGEAEVITWIKDERRRQADFIGELAQAARPLIFHAAASVEQARLRFGVPAVRLPLAVYSFWRDGELSAAARARARAALGLQPAERLICSFGNVDTPKGVVPALHAMQLLQAQGVACRLLWVGLVIEDDIARIEALAAELGVAELVHFNKQFVADSAYRQYLLAADAGLQLRLGSAGNISGALQDCIVAGLPCVASADLAANIEAPSYVTRVADHGDPAEIATALAMALDMGRRFEAERQAYCAQFSMERYAEKLCEVLEV